MFSSIYLFLVVFPHFGFEGGTVVLIAPVPTSRKHLRTKVTPDFHLKYSKTGGNLGSESK